MGAVGSAYDNAIMESFWGRVQVELLNRKKWKTRIELATAIFDYIELFHNTRRRHSALGMRTPSEAESRWLQTQDERLLPKDLSRLGGGESGGVCFLEGDEPAGEL